MKNQNTNTELSFALITGASAGIGKSFANEMAKAGYNVVLVARRENKLEEIAKVCGSTCLSVAAHISLCSTPIYLFGNEKKKKKYLVPLASGESIGSFSAHCSCDF